MSSQQPLKPQAQIPHEPRISITNIPGLDRIDRMDRQRQRQRERERERERYDRDKMEKPVDKVKKSIQRMENTLKEFQYQVFDLREVEGNWGLIRGNRKFATLLATMQKYNKKLQQKRENDIINYKLHEFYYSTLRICNTKTQSQVEHYLQQINSWLNKYNHKRQLIFNPNKKYTYNKDEDDVIRQTFKSNLPLQVDQYRRRLCVFTAPKDGKGKGKGKGKGDRQDEKKKLNHTLGRFEVRRDDSDSSGDQFVKDIIDDDAVCQEKVKHNNKTEFELPNLRAYRAQILKVRKAREDRQQATFFQNLKKNQSRNLTQSSNNFYKPLRNRNDIFHKSTNEQACAFDASEKTRKILDEGDSPNSTKREAESNYQKENNRIIVNSTSMGFYQIKKKNLNKVLGLRKNESNNNNGGKVVFPKFFMNTDGYFNQQCKSTDLELLQGKKENDGDLVLVQNITGLSLLKNPIEAAKPKKDKKNR